MMRYFAVALIFLGTTMAHAEEWGTVKGQVVWKGDPMPQRKAIDLVKNPQCAAQKPPLQDDILVDPKTRGVKDILVWLAPEGSGTLAIHPDLKPIPNKEHVIDQPCCLFEPRVSAMRVGQVLVVKNSAAFAHNVHLSPGSGGKNGETNQMLQPNSDKRFDKDKRLVADPFPLKLGCDIHGFMGGMVGVFDHPYFAVTAADGTFEIKNAPVGKVRLFMKHDLGWVHEPRESNRAKQIGGRYGQSITILGAKGLDLGKIEMKP